MLVDGDDFLVHRQVLTRLNTIYQDPDVWITWGQFVRYPPSSGGFCEAIPPAIVSANAFRDYPFVSSHLRTFFAGLYQRVRPIDVQDCDGRFFVIAGDVAGHAGPGSTHTPITLVHATLAPGARLALPWSVDFNALVYVLNGNGTVGAEQRPVTTGQLAVLGAGDFVTVQAATRQESRTPELDVLVLGGRPIREPVAWAGPFVMNTRAEVMQAYEDFQKGRMGEIPAVHGAPTELQEG